MWIVGVESHCQSLPLRFKFCSEEFNAFFWITRRRHSEYFRSVTSVRLLSCRPVTLQHRRWPLRSTIYRRYSEHFRSSASVQPSTYRSVTLQHRCVPSRVWPVVINRRSVTLQPHRVCHRVLPLTVKLGALSECGQSSAVELRVGHTSTSSMSSRPTVVGTRSTFGYSQCIIIELQFSCIATSSCTGINQLNISRSEHFQNTRTGDSGLLGFGGHSQVSVNVTEE